MSLDNHIILETIATYERTASGKNWKSKPTKIDRNVVSAEYYHNKTDGGAVKFWNNAPRFSCRARKGYTSAGYIVTSVTMVNGWENIKTVESYDVVYKPDMLRVAGYRERDILERAVTFEKDKDTVSFYTSPDESGHADGCEWHFKRYCWVG